MKFPKSFVVTLAKKTLSVSISNELWYITAKDNFRYYQLVHFGFIRSPKYPDAKGIHLTILWASFRLAY